MGSRAQSRSCKATAWKNQRQRTASARAHRRDSHVRAGRHRTRAGEMGIDVDQSHLSDAASLVQPMAADKKLRFVVELLKKTRRYKPTAPSYARCGESPVQRNQFTDRGEVRLGCTVEVERSRLRSPTPESNRRGKHRGCLRALLAGGANRDAQNRRHRSGSECNAQTRATAWW